MSIFRAKVLNVSYIMDAQRTVIVSLKRQSLYRPIYCYKEIPVLCPLSQLIKIQSCHMLQIVHYCICPLPYVYMRPGFYHFIYV